MLFRFVTGGASEVTRGAEGGEEGAQGGAAPLTSHLLDPDLAVRAPPQGG